ncbi:hypothetical protein [Mesorhizobium sp. B2-4-6]|uniref:hypothetical protein n=1 Tax=Mesorhizobium sp. B2-4-6 TaxID=2589943 RepID=UPI00112D459D|nr:hypothetical protein [Mesorhizobium sp. B2-4-6]TPL48306.1 hypothetical protein FJ957_14210 [Mesorhizobium sp. B2-4-6]
MNAHKTTKPNDPAQSRAFIEKAREIEADEKKSDADALMGKLAHMPPDPKPKPKPKGKTKKAAK